MESIENKDMLTLDTIDSIFLELGFVSAVLDAVERIGSTNAEAPINQSTINYLTTEAQGRVEKIENIINNIPKTQ